jgi:hypothetical protein
MLNRRPGRSVRVLAFLLGATALKAVAADAQ